jgi:hypothetical protein
VCACFVRCSSCSFRTSTCVVVVVIVVVAVVVYCGLCGWLCRFIDEYYIYTYIIYILCIYLSQPSIPSLCVPPRRHTPTHAPPCPSPRYMHTYIYTCHHHLSMHSISLCVDMWYIYIYIHACIPIGQRVHAPPCPSPRCGTRGGWSR